MAPTTLYDGAHADMLEAYIQAKLREGYSLVGTEIPYRRGAGCGYVDVVMKRDAEQGAVTELLVAELKTVLLNLGQAIRQVQAAQQSFLASHGGLIDNAPAIRSRYPLVVWASDANLRNLAQYSHVLSGLDVEIFHPDIEVAAKARGRLQIRVAIRKIKAHHHTPSGLQQNQQCERQMPRYHERVFPGGIPRTGAAF